MPLLGIGRDERGATAVIVAVLGAVLIGTAGVALDTGLYFSQQSNLQTVTEAAALSAAAAANIDNARSNALASLARNGYAAATLTVTLGYYCPDNDASTKNFATAPGSCPGGTTGNTAVKLETTAPSTSYLTRALGGGALIPQLAATATAARVDEAGLEMTTGVLALDSGLVNNLLSTLAGLVGAGTINLSPTRLQALLASNTDAGFMLDALAVRVGETGTYGDLVKRTVSLADLMGACATAQIAAGGDANTIGALQYLSGPAFSGIPVPLKDLFGLGVWKNTPVDTGGGGTSRKTGLRAGLNSYQLLTYALQTNGRTANLPTLAAIRITGIADVKLIGMATSELGSASFAFGPKGETTVSTARVRLHLSLKLLDTNALLGALDVPLLSPVSDLDLVIQVAPGTAKITGITCGNDAATDTKVLLTANSGLLDVFLGKPSANAMASTRLTALTANDFTPSTLVNVLGLNLLGVKINLASVTLKVAIGQAFADSQNLVFAQSGQGGDGTIGRPPYGGTAYTVRNRSSLADTVRNLTIDPTICLLSAIICLPPVTVLNTVLKTVADLLTAVALDSVVDSLLRGLGLQLGYANVWVTGARCGVPVLV
jgi:uncharacterized membrane protein